MKVMNWNISLRMGIEWDFINVNAIGLLYPFWSKNNRWIIAIMAKIKCKF